MSAAEESTRVIGGYQVLSACCLVTLVLGSIHAFSVLITPLEQHFSGDRGAISMVYAVGLVCLTVAVSAGWRVYHRVSPGWIVMTACGLGAGGLLMSSLASGYSWLLAGYGMLFGLANGLGYGFVLQLSARTEVVRPAAAMALVTAGYALGATGFAFLLTYWQAGHGISGALMRQAGVVFFTGLLAGLMLRLSGMRYIAAGNSSVGSDSRPRGVSGFWLAYGCNVFAGLMAMGHAAEIMSQSAGGSRLAYLGAVLIGLGNAAGGVAVALPMVSAASTRLLMLFPGITMAALLFLSLTSTVTVTLLCLTIVGIAYGASIAVYPAVINQIYGAAGPAVYGAVFTAWGMAGLAGPWLAGSLFSLSGSYRLPLLVGALLAMASCFFVTRLPTAPPTQR